MRNGANARLLVRNGSDDAFCKQDFVLLSPDTDKQGQELAQEQS